MRRAAAALALAALAAGCGEKRADEVRVFAASSLAEVMQTIAADFEKETGVKVKLNLAASSTLAKQIVEGAPCDVFLSADQEWADFVEKSGFVESGTRRDLLTNSLVLVRGKGARPPVSYAADRIRRTRGKIAMGDPSHVPAGMYAKATLQAPDLWHDVEGRVVPCESVRAAMALVERGEVEQAIVYATDARASRRDWEPEPFPQVPGVRIRYPAMRIDSSRGRGAGLDRYLDSLASRKVFERAGFGIARASD